MCRCGVGSIEVLCGPMCSGKTEEVDRRLRRAIIAGKSVEVFCPKDKGRYESSIEARNGARMEAVPIVSALEAVAIIKGRDYEKIPVVAFDESQWIEELAEGVDDLAEFGCRVIVSGLDMDYRGVPFLEMGLAMCIADAGVTKLTSVSRRCECRATHTARLGEGEDMGGEWEPMCRGFWRKYRSGGLSISSA